MQVLMVECWETSPHSDLQCTSKQKKVNPSIPNMPSKSASLLTLGNVSKYTWIAFFVWPVSYLSSRENFPQFLFGLFHLFFFFFWLLYPIVNENFLIFFWSNSLKVSHDDDTVRKWKKENIFVNWSGHPQALKWGKKIGLGNPFLV